jgi:hypothetical protein
VRFAAFRRPKSCDVHLVESATRSHCTSDIGNNIDERPVSAPTIQSRLCPFGSQEDHTRGRHSENDDAILEAVRSWLRGAGADSASQWYLKFVRRLQKCVDRYGDFVEK